MANKVSYLIFHITGIKDCSVEACPSLKVLFCFLCLSDIIIIYYCHYYLDNGSQLLSRCTTRYMNYFTCDVKLT